MNTRWTRSGRKWLTLLAPWLATLGLALGAMACEPFADPQDFDREEVLVFKRSALVPPKDPGKPAQLRVVAWNVKYAAARIPFWFDCWGDKAEMSAAEVDANMAKLYAAIDELNPDVLMTEEIEVNSKRSAYFDMVRGILENTDLNYAAYYETWDSQYVASEGVGRINLGNAIFSKYPITKAERIRQVDRTDQDALTAMFYIKRAVGRAEIEIRKGEKVVAMVVHTEAYDNDGTKQKQIKQIHELALKETLPLVLGGDFNELPPSAAKVVGFMDEREKAVCSDDFIQPPYTPAVMQPFYDDLLPHIDLSRYGASENEQKRYYTHSVLGPDDSNDKGEKGFWNRTLDYLFVSKGSSWVVGSTDVAQQQGQRLGGEKGLGPVLTQDYLRLSDHAPVTGLWEVK
jgi:endonuclease/exonuclease/phosphatase family metal-dependent hydrolase